MADLTGHLPHRGVVPGTRRRDGWCDLGGRGGAAVAGFSLGALLSALTITEANRLADIADAYRAGDKQTAADLVAVID